MFVGDSRVRQLYQASRSLLEKGQEPQFQQPEEPAHHDMTWKKKALNLRLDFFWAPLVDEDMIGVSFPKYCKKKIYLNFVVVLQVLRNLKSGSSGLRPGVVVIGSATHSIKSSNNSADALEAYKKSLERLKPVRLSYSRIRFRVS